MWKLLWVVSIGVLLIAPYWSEQIESDKRAQTIELLQQAEQSNDADVKNQAEQVRKELIAELQLEVQRKQDKLEAEERAKAEMQKFYNQHSSEVTVVFVVVVAMFSIALIFYFFVKDCENSNGKVLPNVQTK